MEEPKLDFFIPLCRPSPRNRVFAITFASYRNIEEKTRFIDPRDRLFFNYFRNTELIIIVRVALAIKVKASCTTH